MLSSAMQMDDDEYQDFQDYGPHSSQGGSGMSTTGSTSMSKAELRKCNKPIMEKKRRARINHCLNELKTLILDATKKDPARHSKLEKADILEMTVKHLQTVQKQQLTVAVSTDPTVLHKFKTGFSECATEVSRYVARLEGVEPTVRQRLLGHLNQCVNGLQQISPFSFPPGGQQNANNTNAAPAPTTPASSTLAAPTPVQGTPNPSPQMPFPAGDVNNNNTRVTNSLQLIPSRLPSGELAFVLPNSATSRANSDASNPPYFPAPTTAPSRPSAFTAVQRAMSPSSLVARPPMIVSPSSSSGDESSSSYPLSQSPSPPQIIKPTALTLELKTLAVGSSSGSEYAPRSPVACTSKGVLDFSMKPPPPPKRHVEVLGDSSNSKIPRMAFPNLNMAANRLMEAENTPRHSTGPAGAHDSMWRPW